MSTHPAVPADTTMSQVVVPRRGMTLPAREFKLAEFHERIREVLADPKVKIYLDTSLLMWLLGVSGPARREFLNWCDSATLTGKVFVTTWCAQELYRHCKEGTVFSQINDRVKSQRKFLDDVVRFADQAYDDVLCATTDFVNRAAAIEGLRNSAGLVSKNLDQVLQKSLKAAYSGAEEEVRRFVNAHTIWTGSTDIVANVRPEFLNRAEGRLPPGYKDGGKGENNFGDFVFWREVLADAEGSSVVILTNDGKTDWIHSITRVESYDGKTLGRSPQDAVEVQLPHPYLTFEASARGIGQLEVLNVGTLALLLESEEPRSMKFLIHAAYPRGLDQANLPDWAKLGIGRPPEPSPSDLQSITLHALKQNTPSNLLRQALYHLAGPRERVDTFKRTEALPQVLPTFTSIETVLLGKAFFRAESTFPGTQSFADVLQIAAQVQSDTQAALYLGMLLGIYYDNDLNVRRTPEGQLGQGLFELATEPYAEQSLERLGGILDTENVWVVAKPRIELGAVPVSFRYRSSDDSPQVVSSIAVGDIEVLDLGASDQRRLHTFFPEDECYIEELLRLLAEEFCVPFDMLATEEERDKRVTWEGTAGLGLLRTDLRKVAADFDVAMEEPGNA